MAKTLKQLKDDPRVRLVEYGTADRDAVGRLHWDRPHYWVWLHDEYVCLDRQTPSIGGGASELLTRRGELLHERTVKNCWERMESVVKRTSCPAESRRLERLSRP